MVRMRPGPSLASQSSRAAWLTRARGRTRQSPEQVVTVAIEDGNARIVAVETLVYLQFRGRQAIVALLVGDTATHRALLEHAAGDVDIDRDLVAWRIGDPEVIEDAHASVLPQ